MAEIETLAYAGLFGPKELRGWQWPAAAAARAGPRLGCAAVLFSVQVLGKFQIVFSMRFFPTKFCLEK